MYKFRNIALLFLTGLLNIGLVRAQISVSGGTGLAATYTSFTKAGGLFAAINGTAQTGNTIVVTITGDVTNEDGANSLNAGAWASISITPSGNRTISGAPTAGTPLFNFNGADNVTINGQNSGGNSLILSNTTNSATANTSTIRLINGATNNTLTNCTVLGSFIGNFTSPTSGGVIQFSTDASTANGNDGNTISNNTIGPAGSNLPTVGILSIGTTTTSALNNSGNTISGNNIYDCFNAALPSSGIYLGAGNTDWTAISSNKFYQTASRTQTTGVQHSAIWINNTSGNNFGISTNTIGYSNSSGTGNYQFVGTTSSSFIPVFVNVGTTTATSVQGNTITNISYTSAPSGDCFIGIRVSAGAVNIGTTSGNNIGNNSGTGAIAISSTTSGNNVYGIFQAGTGTVSIQNNIIGSFTLSNNAANASNFFGIYNSANSTLNVSSNTIGSTTISNSINVSSTATGNTQSVYGIHSTNGTSTISSNNIANLTSASTNTTSGVVNGILVSGGSSTISSNSVFSLSSACGHVDSTNLASVIGIVLTSTTATQTISTNTIYSLSNTNSGAVGVSVIGILYRGPSTGTNVVTRNFVYSLSASSSSNTALLNGVRILDLAGTAANVTFSDNIISLCTNTTGYSIYGVYLNCVNSSSNYYGYQNTVYIGGQSAASGMVTAAYFQNTDNATSVLLKNNIFYNARTNASGSVSHYAAYFNFTTSGGSSSYIDYNDYWVTGSAGVLGRWNGLDKTALPIIGTCDANGKNLDPGFTSLCTTSPINYTPSNISITGVTGLGVTVDYFGNAWLGVPAMGAIRSAVTSKVDVYIASVLQAGYTTLKGAFDNINSGTHTGVIELRVNGSTTETASAVLNASGSGSANYTGITLYPTTSGLSISGALAAPLIDFNGVDNFVLDGRVNQAGAKDLTISNTNTGATVVTITVKYRDGATNNQLKYCNVYGSFSGDPSTPVAGGVIVFSTDASTANGNDGNTISYNTIGPAGSNLPTVCINALGTTTTTALNNSGITISNNFIYDYFKTTVASSGIYVGAGNTDWTISSNRFYQSATRTQATAGTQHSAIWITNTSGNNFTVSSNIIGYSASAGTGNYTFGGISASKFYPIYVSAGTSTTTNVQGNTITNISYTGSQTGDCFAAINVAAGNVNIGTSTANTIGATTGTGAITVSSSAASEMVYGILVSSSGTVDVQNNTIGSVTAANTGSDAANLYGIKKTNVGGTTTISNNIIGSTSTANSFYASSTANTGGAASQQIYGIHNFGTGTITISGNTVANVTNACTNTTAGTMSYIKGIVSDAGTVTISNNTVRDLTIACANTSTTNPSIVGVGGYNSVGSKVISGNTVYNLSNTYSSYAGEMFGIYYVGPTSGTNEVKSNFVHSIRVSSSSASIYGIKISSGVTTYSNNIINLGYDVTTVGPNIYGIYDPGTASDNCTVLFNTVYISGTVGAGAGTTACLYSASNSNTRVYKNNIFVNQRTVGASKHYAIYLNYNFTPPSLDYNNYWVSGTAVVGRYLSADVTTVPVVSGQDANSVLFNPGLANAGGTTAANYLPSCNFIRAVTGTGITTDYNNAARASIPTMGALESTFVNVVDVFKSGVLQASYPTLKGAFDRINDGTHNTGALVVKINASTYETASAVLNASGSGSANYTSVTIYPTATSIEVYGILSTPLIDFNGADNVTIDGRVNASGSTVSLTIENASAVTSASTIRYYNDASTCTTQYCNVLGSAGGAVSAGTIFISTGASTGNDNLAILNNNIGPSSGTPTRAIYGSGSVAAKSSSTLISGNNIYDYFDASNESGGVVVSSYCDGWTISNNKFYQSSSRAATAAVAHSAILMNNSETGHTVSGNTIGYASSSGTGTYTYSNSNSGGLFIPIYFKSVGTASSSAISANTIASIAVSGAMSGTTNTVAMIDVTNGLVNIGTSSATGNVIGSMTNNSSITFTSSAAANTTVYGICNHTNTDNVVISYNSIGGVFVANSSTGASNIVGIYCSNNSANTADISNNTVGSSVSNSLQSTTTSTSTTCKGIVNVNAAATINNNTICNMSAAGGTGTNTSASLIGILNQANGTNHTISGNTIYTLTNTAAAATIITGICFNSSTGTNTITKNFIHSLVGANTGAVLNGIEIRGGTATYSNNIISLGYNYDGSSITTALTIYGISEGFGTNRFYFNTINIGGTGVGTTASNTYCLWNNVNNTREYKDNIFSNYRSNSTTGGKHYGLYLFSTTGLTTNYNNFFVSGTGTVLGFLTSDRTTLANFQTATSQDANSLNSNPSYSNIAGVAASAYYPTTTTLNGTAAGSITTDYFSATRTTPKMGAIETSPAIVDVYKSGVLQASYINLKGAFDRINDGTHNTGALEIKINGSTSESTTASLSASGAGSANYTSITIYPTVTGLTVSGSFALPLVKFSGADNVTINGTVNASGSSADLTFINSSTSSGASTILYENDATSNLVTYAKLFCYNSNSGTSVDGVVIYSTTTGTTGNDNNSITNCYLGSNDNTKLVGNVILSNGTSTKLNSGITLTGNYLFDFKSNAVYLSNNSDSWTISSNSFYNTLSSFAITADVYCVNIPSGANATSLTLNSNYVGGRAALCLGSPLSVTTGTMGANFIGFLVNSSGGTVTINSNTIQNITFAQTANGSAINGIIGLDLSGSSAYTVGQSGSPNLFGSMSGTGSIAHTGSVQSDINIIKFGGTGTNSIAYNNFGGISQSTTSGSIYLINNSGAGTTTISNNTLGSTVASNISNTAVGNVAAINITSTGTFSVQSNTIQQFSISNSGGSAFYGIYGNNTTGITLNCQNNTLKKIVHAGTGTFACIQANFATGSSNIVSYNTLGGVVGDTLQTAASGSQQAIYLNVSTASTAGSLSVRCSGNTISRIKTTNALYGIYYQVMSGGGITSTSVNIDSNTVKNVSCSAIEGIEVYCPRATNTVNVRYNTIGSTDLDNITCTAGSTNYGLYVTSPTTQTDTYTFTNNTIQQFNQTAAGSGFRGIQIPTGTITCSNNVIKNISSGTGVFYGINLTASSGSSNTVNSNYIGGQEPVTGLSTDTIIANTNSASYGIQCKQVAATATYTVESNYVAHIDLGGSGGFTGIYVTASGSSGIRYNQLNNLAVGGSFYGIDVANATGTPTITITGNYIGNSITNNITVTGISGGGIYLSSTQSNTYSVTDNYVQQVYLPTSTASGEFFGIFIETSSAAATISNNRIFDITSASDENSNYGTGPTVALAGIFTKSSSNSQTISGNKIYRLKLTTASGQWPIVDGILLYGDPSASAVCYNNRIEDLENLSTNTVAGIHGITIYKGAWTIYNNVVLLSNASNTNNILIYGIANEQSSASNRTNNIYHNTVSISGSTASGTTAAFIHDIDIFGGTFTTNVVNNIFIASRTSSSASYAMHIVTSTGLSTYNYNYVQSSSSNVCYIGSARTFSQWVSAGTGVNTDYDLNGTITLNALGAVPAATNNDVKNTGTNLFTTVSADIDGNARTNGSATIPGGPYSGPWRGAYESISALPVTLSSLTAQCTDEGERLEWYTLSEKNNQGFYVMRSTDANSFEMIGYVAGYGNSNTVKKYNFIDRTPISRVNYYKLVQHDFDGTSAESKTVEGLYDCNEIETDMIVQVYYAPSDNMLKLELLTNYNSLKNVSVLDISGRYIMSQSLQVMEGVSRNEIWLPELAGGTYVVVVTDDTGLSSTKKFVVAR